MKTKYGIQFERYTVYENPWTIPNCLCMARIALAPVLGCLIVEQYFHLSLGLFVLAGATDLLDGYIARNWANQKSALGSALDPLADKILISALYISLTYAGLIPAPLTGLVISRDVALIAAVFYVNTAIQLVLVAASLSAPVFHYTDSCRHRQMASTSASAASAATAAPRAYVSTALPSAGVAIGTQAGTEEPAPFFAVTHTVYACLSSRSHTQNILNVGSRLWLVVAPPPSRCTSSSYPETTESGAHHRTWADLGVMVST
ncbi:hypothetical protein JZ751_003638 [Albula glossodonta]|uniref:cardiolipin synthase (CMP-forming) n=1 Tax=Albula glossodonta TaxID=121402 RepID=A0A8T2N784_9TELE|nr:hypothetical protein JZ751_003638 [Albula glossodonta]